MLAFLLDIVEVPEYHTGVALAKAFQKMLETFLRSFFQHSVGYISARFLAVECRNATSNDTQENSWQDMPNSSLKASCRITASQAHFLKACQCNTSVVLRTSTISNKKANMVPLCSRCTVQATHAWWLVDVHVSVVKCTNPGLS